MIYNNSPPDPEFIKLSDNSTDDLNKIHYGLRVGKKEKSGIPDHRYDNFVPWLSSKLRKGIDFKAKPEVFKFKLKTNLFSKKYH